MVELKDVVGVPDGLERCKSGKVARVVDGLEGVGVSRHIDVHSQVAVPGVGHKVLSDHAGKSITGFLDDSITGLVVDDKVPAVTD